MRRVSHRHTCRDTWTDNERALMSDDDEARRGRDAEARSREGLTPETAMNKKIKEASLRERLQAQLEQLRAQVRRLNIVLDKAVGPDVAIPAPPAGATETNTTEKVGAEDRSSSPPSPPDTTTADRPDRPVD